MPVQSAAMASLLRKSTWIWPLAFALVLTLVGWHAMSTLRATMRAQVKSQVETTLAAAATAVEVWSAEQQIGALAVARDPEVRELVLELLALSRSSSSAADALRESNAQTRLQQALHGTSELRGYVAWGVFDETGLLLATNNGTATGYRPGLARVVLGDGLMPGRTDITPPIMWDSGVVGAEPFVTMIVSAPIVDDEGRAVAQLAFALDPDDEFGTFLEVGSLGESGETYAFDEAGVMVSHSRFEADLRSIGLMPDEPGSSAAFTVELRDPGGNLTAGYRTDTPMKARPFTLMAAQAIAGESGSNVDGYIDYRGVPVAGAWTWLPDLKLGLATEIDMSEAFAGLVVVRRDLLSLIGLLVLGTAGMLIYSLVVMMQQGELDEAKQLGRYRIERKLGAGGMGTVYLASHALLRRPTAIKVVKVDTVGDEGIKRFEREVQVTSALSHPNTIDIYDYGTTPDGTFYYAMELLRGITITALVESDGPQPERRVVSIMKQAAASLAEAHAAGLIHRDLKPSNIMLCERGGVLDFVKVLDFGLVRSESQSQDMALTSTASLTGTPLYMSPESVESPEKISVRSDVYQLGAIAWYLLAGRHVFPGDSLVDVLSKHIGETPEPLADVRGEPVHPGLEAIVLRCLAKRPEDRPADAGELLELLEACEVEGEWGQREARGWWAIWREAHPEDLDAEGSTASTMPSAYSIDLKGRLS
jgi:hypothetical protein